MTLSGENAVASTVPLREAYLLQLREHALTLIWLGYQRMDAPAFAAAEEDSITGELVRQIKAELQRTDPEAPEWFEHYAVNEQVRSNATGRLGKRRAIVDVEFERVKRGSRPCLRFEAKRLGRGSGVKDYLGAEGLGAFLTGHYPRTHNEAGMLGYIQARDQQAWAKKISTELSSRRRKYRVVTGDGWEPTGPPLVQTRAYRSKHTDSSGTVVIVLHLLLNFTGNRTDIQIQLL